MFLAGTPTHRVRQVILEHSTAVSVVGPMHIVSTLIFFIGIVLRIFALEMSASLRLVYMVPLSTAFLFARVGLCTLSRLQRTGGCTKRRGKKRLVAKRQRTTARRVDRRKSSPRKLVLATKYTFFKFFY